MRRIRVLLFFALTIGVALSLAWCQVEEFITRPSELYRPFVIGWPFLFFAWQPDRVITPFKSFTFAIDLVFSLTILCFTVVVTRSWLLKPKRIQFSIKGILLFMLTVGAVLGLQSLESDEKFMRYLFFEWHLSINAQLSFSEGPVSALFLLYGVGCLVYGVCALALSLLRIIWGRLASMPGEIFAAKDRKRCCEGASEACRTRVRAAGSTPAGRPTILAEQAGSR